MIIVSILPSWECGVAVTVEHRSYQITSVKSGRPAFTRENIVCWWIVPWCRGNVRIFEDLTVYSRAPSIKQSWIKTNGIVRVKTLCIGEHYFYDLTWFSKIRTEIFLRIKLNDFESLGKSFVWRAGRTWSSTWVELQRRTLSDGWAPDTNLRSTTQNLDT